VLSEEREKQLLLKSTESNAPQTHHAFRTYNHRGEIMRQRELRRNYVGKYIKFSRQHSHEANSCVMDRSDLTVQAAKSIEFALVQTTIYRNFSEISL
jgi:hypothetical protein